MRCLRLLIPCLLCISVISCQKSVDWATTTTTGTTPGAGAPGTPGTGGTTGNRLVKDVGITGTDTITTLYTYDAQGRFETDLMEGKSGGMYYKSYRKVFRDADGRIIKIQQKIDQTGITSDTSVTLYHYPNTTTTQYDYSVMTSGMSGLESKDSALYTYSGSNMTTNSHYMSSSMMGVPLTPYSLTQKWDFTYDASGKVTKMVNSSNLSSTPGPLQLAATYTYTYSTINFQGFYTTDAAQNYAIGGLPTGNATQVNTTTVVSPTTPQANRTITYSYTLGANGKPATVNATVVTVTPPATELQKHTLYYQ